MVMRELENVRAVVGPSVCFQVLAGLNRSLLREFHNYPRIFLLKEFDDFFHEKSVVIVIPDFQNGLLHMALPEIQLNAVRVEICRASHQSQQ